MTCRDELEPGIGPHEGKELKLLLMGVKPVAYFTLDGLASEYESKFEKHVERGVIVKFTVPDAEDARFARRYYCLPGEEWRVKLMELVLVPPYPPKFSAEELHRMHGALLGYIKEDVEVFIAHWKAVRD